MRVVVLNPPVEKERYSRDGRCQSEESSWIDTFPPTTLASVAGAVREDHETILIDCVGERLSKTECMALIIDFLPEFIVSNTSTTTFEYDLETLAELKKKTKCKCAIYGETVSSNYTPILQSKQIDYILLGEPETPLLNILKGNPKVKGVAMEGWDGGLWQEPDLDDLPFPAYDLLPKYRYPLTGEAWMFVRSGRGCPYNCSYCIVPKISGRKARYHSVEYMIKQFKWLIEELDIKLWMFWDDISTVDKDRMIELCKEMISENLSEKAKWFCTTRVDCFDNELAYWMSKAGCKMLSFGFESGNQDVLDKNQKGITLSQSRSAVKSAKKYGLKTIGHFIIGLPGSSAKSAKDTSRFAKNLKINFAQFYIATPFLSSKFYDDALKNNWIVDKDWKKIEQGSAVISYPNFSQKQIARAKRKSYFSFYFRPYAFYSLFTSISFRILFKLPQYFFTYLRWMRK